MEPYYRVEEHRFDGQTVSLPEDFMQHLPAPPWVLLLPTGKKCRLDVSQWVTATRTRGRRVVTLTKAKHVLGKSPSPPLFILGPASTLAPPNLEVEWDAYQTTMWQYALCFVDLCIDPHAKVDHEHATAYAMILDPVRRQQALYFFLLFLLPRALHAPWHAAASSSSHYEDTGDESDSEDGKETDDDEGERESPPPPLKRRHWVLAHHPFFHLWSQLESYLVQLPLVNCAQDTYKDLVLKHWKEFDKQALATARGGRAHLPRHWKHLDTAKPAESLLDEDATSPTLTLPWRHIMHHIMLPLHGPSFEQWVRRHLPMSLKHHWARKWDPEWVRLEALGHEIWTLVLEKRDHNAWTHVQRHLLPRLVGVKTCALAHWHEPLPRPRLMVAGQWQPVDNSRDYGTHERHRRCQAVHGDMEDLFTNHVERLPPCMRTLVEKARAPAALDFVERFRMTGWLSHFSTTSEPETWNTWLMGSSSSSASASPVEQNRELIKGVFRQAGSRLGTPSAFRPLWCGGAMTTGKTEPLCPFAAMGKKAAVAHCSQQGGLPVVVKHPLDHILYVLETK
jgi:hypothetical protein